MRRPLVLIAVLLAGLALNACGNADEPASEGETEAVYLDLDGLQYQVQISRQLNPVRRRGQLLRPRPEPAGSRARRHVVRVFVRVYNPTDTPKQATTEFEIHDTQGNVYKPVPLDDTNVFRYVPASLGSEKMIPTPGSPAFNSPIRGSLLLFRVKIDSFENRPLEFIIRQPGSTAQRQVPLDV